jgi:AraC-like DNA-binding protein
MSRGPTISRRYALRILETAAAAGVQDGELERAVPMVTFDHHGDARIAGADYYALWSAAMDRVGDPAFPLRVAASTGIETYDVFGFACMTSQTFREGLENAARYLGIWTDVAGWRLTVDGPRATLQLVPAPLRHPGSRYAAECALAEVVHTSRKYLDVAWVPQTVQFPWPRPSAIDHLESYFGVAPTFGAPAAALVIDANLLALPLPKADATMAAFFRRHADEMLAQAPRAASIVEQVRRFIAGFLQRGTPTLDDAALELATSSRTLRRRLADEDASFAQLLQDTRCALAKQHLAEDRLAISEIAFLLGFSDVTAFHRSFRRWTGQTPAAFRTSRRTA